MVRKFVGLLGHSIQAYGHNIKLISAFSLPFLVAFPLALSLPNFVSLGGIFLRIGSIRSLSVLEAAYIVAAFFVSLLLFSFAIVAINVVLRSQRTLTHLTHYEVEKIEHCTFRYFRIMFIAFLAGLAANIFLFEQGLHYTVGAVVSFGLAVAVLFAAQAIVIDDMRGWNAVGRSISLIFHQFKHFVLFMAFAAVLLVANDFFFLQLQSGAGLGMAAKYLAVAVNSLLILPFLEVLKTQIYLSKYSLLD